MTTSGEAEAGSPPSLILFTVGVVAILIAGLQPVVLGALEHEGRLTLSQIGVAAMVELLAIGVACGLAAAFLPTRRMRLVLSLAAIAHAAVNLACIPAVGGGLIALRGLTGALAGLMLWSCVAMIARSRRPERLAGAFVTVQTLAQLAVAAILPLTAMALAGAAGGFASLAFLSILTAAIVWRGPDALTALAHADKTTGGLPKAAWAGLAAAFLQMAFNVSLFVYLEPLADHAGMPAGMAGLATATILAAQVVGGFAAIAAGGRLGAAPALILAMTAGLASLAALWAAPAAGVFIAAAAIYGFAWLFSLPFHTALLIDLDPSRRGAMQLGAAQLLGSAFGPLAASVLVESEGIAGVAIFAAAAIGFSMAIVAATRRRPVEA
ncbi:MFS transporter [Caulobacter segnis]|uniref:MFS transporter n=1 Tax=Caulobacter segnis TaxID=88688 RepID=UPI00240F2C1B|nr:MFS transporter [Caulobacter segnis]MDG2520325.1 MFS transporter [Caulobacter segnis]